jgi:hypothetical protein
VAAVIDKFSRDKKMGTQKHLVIQHLENISWQVLKEYPTVIKTLIKGKAGVYVLYHKEKVYYAGLASNLMGRLNIHLKDNHKGLWDRFSVYLTVHDEHMKELESLLLRIIKPRGNKISGKFRQSQNLKPTINKRVKEIDDIRRNNFIGGNSPINKKGKPIKITRIKAKSPVDLTKELELRNIYKKIEYRAVLRTDWKIEYNGKLYNTPSASAKFIAGRQMNGWEFWRYKNEKGDWVKLNELRK